MIIKQNFIEGLPHYPYDFGFGGYIGVVAHCTGNYGDKFGDTAINERKFESETWGSAFVHFFCDDTCILQVADLNYKAWGAGKLVNGKYAHVELCQALDKEKFAKGYANYVSCLAYVLAKKKLGVADGKTLVSHSWVSKNLGGTDHEDPIAYLKSHGKSWADLVKDVDSEYKKQTAPVVPNVTINEAVDFICGKIKSASNDYWKHQAHAVQFLDIMVTKVVTQWKKDNAGGINPVKKIPAFVIISAVDVEKALSYIDSKIHLSDPEGWRIKASNVPHLDMFFIKLAYCWKWEESKK